MNRWTTPLGSYDLEIGGDGVSSVKITDGVKAAPVEEPLATALNEHLHGRPGSLKLDLQGLTPMAQVALAKLLEIPYGEVRSYSWVAREIGKPSAVRPVANAVAGNPIPLLIPCHRVVRSDGHMGEFSLGGAEVKRQILEFEGVDVEYLESLARRSIRFLGSKEDNMFHLPSCKRAPEHDSGVMIELKTTEQAVELRLQPCPRCRPSLEE